MHLLDTYKNRAAAIAAILIGAAIPLLPMGIAVTQGMLGLGLILLLVVTPYDLEVRRTYRKLLFNPITFALVIMFAVWFAVTAWSNGPESSTTTIARTILYIAGSALIWTHFSVYQDLQRKSLSVLIILTAMMLAVACASLLLPLDVWKFIQPITGKATAASRHFKAFSSALLCLMPVLIWIGHRRSGNWRLLSWLMMPAILYVMTATGSRSSVAGLLIMLVIIVLAIVWGRGKLPKVIWAALPLTIAAGMAWVWSMGQRYSPITDNFLPTWLIDPHRQVIWRFVFEKFLEAPLTGHGANRINFVPGADTIRTDIQGAVISSHPHNWVLEILSETGIFGLTTLVLVLVLLIWRLLARYKHTDDTAALTLIALSAAFFGSSLFNFSIWSTWWLLTFFVLFAIVSARNNAGARNPCPAVR